MSDNNKTMFEQDDVFLSYDPSQISTPQRRTTQIGKIPGEDAKMRVKLIPDLLDPSRKTTGRLMPYWSVIEHMHEVGVDAKGKPMLQSHPCQKTLGRKTCPECDKYYSLSPQLKAVGEGTAEGKQLKAKLERLLPRQKGWVNYVTPESDYIKALKLPKDLINQLWGKPKTQWREAIESLINKMIQQGLNPYDLKSSVGWLLLWKTGEGFSTKYFADVAQKEVPRMANGRCVGKDIVYEEFVLPDHILKLSISELPNFRQIEFRNAFTWEESVAFADNPMITPSRILDESSRYEADTEAEDKQNNQTPQFPSIESVIPEPNLPETEANYDEINKIL